MTPQIELSEIVKSRLEIYKEKEGCKTFNEAVNLLISKNEKIPFECKIELLKENVRLERVLKRLNDSVRESIKTIERYYPIWDCY